MKNNDGLIIAMLSEALDKKDVKATLLKEVTNLL